MAEDKKRILIVDDDPVTRQALNLSLRAHGYDTAFAPDAVNALLSARRTGPDLIILDLGLPGGSGFSVLKRLKNIASLTSVPVIVVTGSDPNETRARALNAGAVAFLSKPVDQTTLVSAVEAAL